MTALEIINKFFFQWFFIRLFKGGKMVKDKLIVDRWGFIYWVWPNTGWVNNYRFIGKSHQKVIIKL